MTRGLVRNGVVLLAIAIGAGAALAQADTESINRAYAQAHASHEPLRNALQAWLRIAGCVWIAVEWVAVLALWRTWRVLEARVRAHSESTQ